MLIGSAVFGLIWGSFFNVVIYRLPIGASLVRPPSSCPGCRTRIKPYDNVPVVSYLLLRGRCRACGRPISPVYPVVELLTAVAFAAVYLRVGELGWPLLAGWVFAGALIVLAFIDAFHQILPDEITIPGLVLGLGWSFIRDDLSLRGALLGALTGGGFLMFVYLLYRLIRKREGLGLGDVMVMLMIGAFLGWPKTLLTLVLGSFGGVLVGLYVLAVRKKGLQTALPFGTFLAPAAFAAYLWGDAIIRAYTALYR